MTPYRIRVGHEAESGAAGPGPEGRPCELVLASGVVALHRLDVPPAQRRRLSGALRFLVEDLVACDPERLHVVAAPASPKAPLCVGIVDRAWLRQVLASLEARGLRPQRALAETLLPELEPGAWTVVARGADSFVRTGAAEGFALDSPDDGSAPVALRLAVESSPPARIVLRTAEGAAPPDAGRWSRELGVAVEPGPPWSWDEARGEPGLDFLQGEFAPRRGQPGWPDRLRRPALLAAALVALVSAGIAADWAAKAHERRALLAQMNALYRDTFGQGAVVVDAPLQMERALAELRARKGAPGPSDFQPLLGALAARLLDPATQRIEAITYERGGLVVVLAPRDPAAFAALQEALRGKAAALAGLEVKVEAIQSGGARRLRVSARARS